MHKLAGILTRNPVLVGGLAMAPTVVATTSLKNAAALTITLMVTTIPVLTVTPFLRRIPRWMRIPLYALLGALLLIPAYYLVAPLSPTIFDSIGMYFSLTIVNSILYVRAERYAIHKSPPEALWDAVCCCLGFLVAAVLLSVVRELLSANSIWGVPVKLPFRISAAALPFAGFMLLALFAAVGRFLQESLLRLRRRRAQTREARERKEAMV